MRRVRSGDQGMRETPVHAHLNGLPIGACWSPSPAPAVAALGEQGPSAAHQEKPKPEAEKS